MCLDLVPCYWTSLFVAEEEYGTTNISPRKRKKPKDNKRGKIVAFIKNELWIIVIYRYDRSELCLLTSTECWVYWVYTIGQAIS